MHDRSWRRYSSMLMTGEFDLVAEIPAFPAYALPPDAFPGFSAGSYGGSGRGGTGIAHVEYLYRPDYDIRGRMVGVSNTRPADGSELLRQSSLWWASAKARIETMTGEFPLDGGVVVGVGARYMGKASADVEGTPCQLQRWTTVPEHSLDDALSVIRVRIDESWVTLWSNSFSLEELQALVPRLKRVDPDLLDRLRLALADWMRKFEERRDG
jgi:hypothetical protein